VTIEQRTAREAVRNCCRTECASRHVLRSSWSLVLEERRSSCGPAMRGDACAQWATLPRLAKCGPNVKLQCGILEP
jgi:hypothetical protein